jgi:hypothetical protein
MIDYHTKFQNNSLSSVTVALTSGAQNTVTCILLIVEYEHAQKGGTMFVTTFIKNPLTGTTVDNGQKYMKKRNLSFLATRAIRLLSSYEPHTQLQTCTSLTHTYILQTFRRHI